MSSPPGNPHAHASLAVMTDYSPALIPAACTLAQRGALDKDLAIAFGVSFPTIRAWKQQHPDFAAACRLSPEAADAAVERALFRLAAGHDREIEQVALKDGELIRTTVTEHVPPNDKAAIFWLRIRRPGRWAEPMVVRNTPSDLTPTE
ncbi:helix-turn-helix domain-containing protein [Flavisphingomonas formosensis]|uniref:helix-turn-helix domain-containing protein n=1 Tax=Flavisphingomonas formosensis TaxID=861534 RepID=UPI0012F9F600|nr:helix-turn-helix domain-containing protein [Sphingomonas formosensis]